MEHFLLQLFIFLTAAVIAVPIAKKFGLGAVLGYLIAGIVIGPFGLSLIGKIEEVMHFTEFGVVMMLFLVGLELKPSLLWKMKTPILGMGGSQVVGTSIAVFGIGMMFVPWQQALAIALILALSSTAIVLQTLNEKGLTNTSSGRSIFSVLLFQDLAVIPILAVLPLLAVVVTTDVDHHHKVLFDISAYPGYIRLILTLVAIGLIFVLGKYASRPVFKAIAATQVREVFVAAVLALVIGISLLMTAVGLSPALGAFLAGVVLANSEYRHEIESDLEPFKGLLLGIFFISIGASLNFTLIDNNLLLITGLTVGLIVLKWIVLVIVSQLFKMSKSEWPLFAIALAQGGEFAFVLFQVTKTNNVIPPQIIDLLVSAVALSMFLAPLLFIAYEKLCKKDDDSHRIRDDDTISHASQKVIIAGFGRLGTDLGRLLLSAGVKPVIIDHDAANVDVLRKFGFEVYYGDITRLDLLESAGASKAALLLVTIGNKEKAIELVELAHKHYPHLKIAVNASDRNSAHEIKDMGIEHIRRETFGSALALGNDALKILGVHPHEAHRLTQLFQKKDEEMMNELYELHQKDEASYITAYRKHNEDLEKLIQLDFNSHSDEVDKAWTAANPET